MKKFFIITAVLFGVLLLFFLIYNFLFRNNPLDGKVPNVAVIPNEPSASPPKQSDAMKDQKIAPLTDGEGIVPFFDAKDRAVFYLAPDEKALKETFLATGLPKTVVNFPFIPKDIVWSPDGGKALVKKNDTEWALFVRQNEGGSGESMVSLLKPGIESPTWTSLGDRIVYKYFDATTKKRTLNIANPDGSDWGMIGETPFQFLEMRPVPKSSMVAVWNRGNAFERTSLKALPIVGGDMREIFSANYGADYLFAPNGTRILVSNSIEKGSSSISLALLNDQGGEYTNLFVPSLVGKAVWSKNSRFVYYALPGSIPAGSILPNDYYRKPILTMDTFWKVDVETGEKSRVVDPNDIDQSYDAENLVLDADETMLFFHNRHDGKIYRINL
ncbi:MAG: hypothetical protein IPJ67_04745 [Candidatus Moraniibacteriota bacterium]|nr:MAG: hypothetical protein IPJ67_04745 [Candidatus Moranbacteria bacterium]